VTKELFNKRHSKVKYIHISTFFLPKRYFYLNHFKSQFQGRASIGLIGNLLRKMYFCCHTRKQFKEAMGQGPAKIKENLTVLMKNLVHYEEKANGTGEGVYLRDKHVTQLCAIMATS